MDALVVTLPRSELSRLAGVPGVQRVWPAVTYHAQADGIVQTDRVPTVVGAPALWSGLDGGIAAAGDGMRIGIIDDGIDITRPSFSGAAYHYPPGFPKGIRSGTNGKIIVARAFAPPGGSRAHAHGLRPRRLRARHARRGHRRRPLGHHGHLARRDDQRTSPASRRTPTSAPTACSRRRRPSFGLDGNGPEIARAIDRAVADGMDVLNLSLGEPEVESANDVVARAIHGAARAGVVTVVAAGNSGDDLGGGSISSPGSAPDAITVAATSVGRFVGVTLGVLGPGAVPADLGCLRRRHRRARADPQRLEGRRAAGRRDRLRRRPRRRARARAARPALHAPRAPTARSPRARSASSTPSAPRATRPRSTDSQQRSLTVSDLIGARLAQQAAVAGGELTLSLDDTPQRADLRQLRA